MNIAASILAGGRATRMGGVAKGNLKIKNGETIIAHQIRELNSAGIFDIFINANNFTPYEQYGLSLVADEAPSRGPLSGIAAVLNHLQNKFDAVLFLPCDLPKINSTLLNELVKVYMANSKIVYIETSVRSHPLCAIVPCNLCSQVQEALANNELKIETLWFKLGAQKLLVHNEGLLLNINTHESK